MKRTLSILFFTALSGISITPIYAQQTNPDVDTNIWMSKPIVVDGNSQEWNEPLNNFNSETRLAFALGNDQNTLYLVIESLDEVTTGRLIRGGLTLNINTSGKKKDGIKLNFLGMQHAPITNEGGKDSISFQEEKGRHDPGVRSISVSGFKSIADGVLAMPNDAGIQVAAAFNQRRDYICELAIPLTLLNLNGKERKGITYQIKINTPDQHQQSHREGTELAQKGEGRGMSRGGGMGAGGGMGGGMHGGGGGRKAGAGRMAPGNSHEQGQNFAKSDFWIKYELAKPGV